MSPLLIANDQFPLHTFLKCFLYLLFNIATIDFYIGFLGDAVVIDDFLAKDINNKIIIAFSFTTLDDDEHIKFYKVTKRAQVCMLTFPSVVRHLVLTNTSSSTRSQKCTGLYVIMTYIFKTYNADYHIKF